MHLTLDDVAGLLGIEQPGRKRRRKRSLFTLRVRAGLDLLELGRRGLERLQQWRDARARRGTAEDPRLEAALSREGEP